MTAIGIDLGTTNSAAGYCEPDRREPRILPTSAGENLTPSVVSCRKSRRDPNAADLLVGRAAVSNAVSAPADTVFSIKRLIGRTFQEEKVALVREKFNYEVVPAPGGGPGLCVRLGGRDYTPVDVSARILKQVKEDATRALGKDVTHAVITVPAYFEERQRAATREAGAQAGLVVKKIIDEPTAAAIAFGVQARPGGHHRILVYDLGGGTFDISILLMVKDAQGRDQFQVLQIEGDNWLGGDDFDRKIIDKMIESVKQSGADPADDKRFLLLAKQHAEQAKRALSAGTEVEIVLPAAVRHPSGAMVDVELLLTRSEFEDLIRPFVEHSMDLVRKALREQQLEPGDVSDVLLVGGSTLVPLVYQTVQRFFGADKVRQTVNPMECVALGASVLAATLKGVECPNGECKALNDDGAKECAKCGHSLASARAVGDTGVTEVTAMSLGIAAVKGTQADVFVPIIPKSTPYPLREPLKQTFLAPAAGKVICVPVYEGDDAVASKNEEQGKIVFEVPTDIPSSTPVEVSFNYDRNRELTVTIRVQGTKFEKKETLRRDQPRTPKPAAAKEAASWQDELEQTCVFVQTFLERYRSFMDVSQVSKAESDLRRAREVLAYPDEKEGKKFNRVLTMDVFNAGLATQLFLAENAMEGAAADIRDRISRAVRELREAHGRGDQARVRQIEGVLRTAVAQVLERREGVKKIEDTKDYGGLLRLLGESGPSAERKGGGP